MNARFLMADTLLSGDCLHHAVRQQIAPPLPADDGPDPCADDRLRRA